MDVIFRLGRRSHAVTQAQLWSGCLDVGLPNRQSVFHAREMTTLPTDDIGGADGWARLAAARSEFRADAVYLNTASLGLPPRRCVDASEAALDRCYRGTVDPAEFDMAVEEARASYAALVGVDPSWVATGSQVSVFAGLIAASLPPGSEVLIPSGEFTSIVFPFMAQACRGVLVREVPLSDLAESVSAATTLVAVSAVQSADGRLADLDALTAACATTDTRILLDTTQATGWLPIDASRFAYTICGGYKWLLAPRGTCFFTVQPHFGDGLIPHNAGWYGSDRPWEAIYGGPLRLSGDARRFDVSPAWTCWPAQSQALDLLTDVGVQTLHAHSVGLANRFRAALDVPIGNSAIVSLTADQSVPERLKRAGVVGSFRAGRLRLSFYLNNSAADADLAAVAVAGHVGA
jgi:selenocysteine lyase/cysteine desulfurase